MRRLPPLNALRAFEAAARHLSFTKAAQELAVTPAAVSHQVKALEDFYGVPLFRRLTRALVLTEAGQRALPLLRQGFDKLAEAAAQLGDKGSDSVVTVSVTPSFGAKWLVPRLDRFRAAHPELDLRLDATDQLIDFAREDVDLGIRYGAGRYPGLRSDCLMNEESAPVCSPRLLEGSAPLCKLEDLAQQTLLHIDWRADDESAPSWRMWLLAAGVRNVDPTRGPRFGQENLALQAAIEGQGVALIGNVLAAGDLAAGRLVQPFELTLSDPMDFSYFVVSPLTTADRPKVAAFRDWVLAEARQAGAC